MKMVESSTADPNGHDDKRAYRRFIVNLKGQCCKDYKCSQVEIRDFCMGGMYVVYTTPDAAIDQPALMLDQGDIVTIRFSLPLEPGETFQLDARVVRSDMKSMGLAFINPDYPVLQKVINHAQQHENQNVASKPRNEPAYAGVGRDILLKNVRAMTHKPIQTLIDSYMQKQIGVLIDMTDKSVDISEQNAYIAAIETFKNRDKQFKTAFLDNMLRIINSTPENIDQDMQAHEQGQSSSGLSLVDDDAIDEWIARSDIAGKAESVYFEALTGIEQRLSILLGMRIWKQNNPLGPEAFSRAFQEALKELNVGMTVYLQCCKTFRDVLKDGLGDLYKTVNDYLIKNGILPELHYEIKVSEDAGKSPRRIKPKADVDNAGEFLGIRDGLGAGQGAGQGAGHDAGHDAGHNLYDLISSLQTIRPRGTSEVPLHRPIINTEQLLGKLSELSQQVRTGRNAGTDTSELRSISLQLLDQFEQSDGEYSLDSREAAIMETTGSIYDALYRDEIITSGVKQWLSKVELPLLHEAIKDESVLSDKGHVARAFINQLAKLELYNDDSRDHISNSVKRTIEDLLKEVAAQPGMNEQLMSSLLAKVNALVNVQSKAYNDNFSEAQEQCQTEATLPLLKLKQTPAELPVPQEFQMNEWRKRIRRLHVGDWILFDAGSPEAIRLKLAWITDDYSKYVFVNMLGLLEGYVGVDELACLLNSDAAIFLEDVDEPAVDRAQYSMLHKLHSRIMHETTHDQLTKLFNRREFEKQIKAELMDNSQAAKLNAVCIFDVDYFEVVNTTFGYAAGDRLLFELAELFKKYFADFTVLGRVGGNEFAVLLTDCSLQQAIEIVEKQKNEFSSYRFQYEESRTMVTLSAGIVAVDLQQHDVSRLLQTAEAACRLAKSKGVNCLHAVKVDDNQLLENKKLMAWASKIDDSLINGNLVLRYQPISPISEDLMAHHAEILLGVTDEGGSLVSPEPFILAAEKYRRMAEIDRWVVTNVFAYLNAHPHVVEAIGGVAVNLSGLSINDESFIPFILAQIETLKISTEYITFEITETAGIESLSSAAEFINEIKKTGCSFSLDDFGTGMSTYTYLKNLPVDFVKIDGSFVRDIENNENDKAVVKSITEIGHFMGKKIIAECVERESSIDLLRSLGVDYVQGYAIARPKPLKSLVGADS